MKVILFYIGTPTPIFETELEIIKKHEKLGDEVRVLQCTGELSNCHWNVDHINSQCGICRSKFKNGWKVLNPGKNVELRTFHTQAKNNLELPIINSIDDINNFQYDGENIGFGVTASLVSILRDHRFDTRKYTSQIARSLKTAVHVYKTLKTEIMEFKPDIVYLFNGRVGTHLPAKLVCKKFGITFYAYEVSRVDNSYRLHKNKTNHDVISIAEVKEFDCDWNPQKKKVAEDLFKKMRSGASLGKRKLFTQSQISDCLPDDFDLRKKNIAIFNGTIDEYAGVESSNNFLYQPDETAGIFKILESFEADSRFVFYLRVHPHMKEVASTTSQLTDIRELNLRFDNLRVIWPEGYVDTYALLEACDKTITFGSTVGVEATYWGKPSILADRAKFMNFGYAYMPGSHEEMLELVRADLEPKPSSCAAQALYFVSFDGVPYEYVTEDILTSGRLSVTFDRVRIKPDVLPALRHWFYVFPSRFLRVLRKPSLILKKLKTR